MFIKKRSIIIMSILSIALLTLVCGFAYNKNQFSTNNTGIPPQNSTQTQSSTSELMDYENFQNSITISSSNLERLENSIAELDCVEKVSIDVLDSKIQVKLTLQKSIPTLSQDTKDTIEKLITDANENILENQIMILVE